MRHDQIELIQSHQEDKMDKERTVMIMVLRSDFENWRVLDSTLHVLLRDSNFSNVDGYKGPFSMAITAVQTK